jgi:hypothetical protein
MLNARSGTPDRTHTTPARGKSDLPPRQKQITRVYRDLANNVPVAPLGATPRHSRKTPNHSSVSLPPLQRRRKRRTDRDLLVSFLKERAGQVPALLTVWIVLS